MKRSQEIELKVTKKEYFEVDSYDFEELIRNVYKQEDYSFVADIECGNDSQHSFVVEKNIDEYHEGKLWEFKVGGKQGYIAGTLLNDLARKGIIEEGNYLINVCW